MKVRARQKTKNFNHELDFELGRRLASSSKGRPVIHYFSEKSKCTLYAESFVEKWSLNSFERDPNVLWYMTQPYSFSYKNRNGKKVRYTPDLLVEYVDGTVKFFEIKDAKGAQSRKNLEKLSDLQEIFAQEIGYPLELFDQSKEQKGKTAANLQLLVRYQNFETDDEINKKIKQVLPKYGVTVASLIDAAESLAQLPYYAMTMIAQNEFTFDIEEMLNPNTILLVA
jgi:hypothetical protein